MKTKFGLLCLFVILTMMLTACEIGVTTKVNADGSGEMGALFKFTKDEANALSTMGVGSVDTLCESMSSSGTSGLGSSDMTFTQETHGDEIWCVATKAFATLAEMGQGDTTLTVNTAEIKDGKFTFDADFKMDQSMDTTSLSQIKGLGYSIVMYYELVAPGNIDKAKTAGFDKVDGNTARMTIIDTKNDVMPSQDIHVHVESNTKGGGSSGGGVSLTKKVAGVPVWGIIVALCCCLLLVVIIVVVVFFVMKKKPKQPAV